MKYKELKVGDWFVYNKMPFIKVLDNFGRYYGVSLDIPAFGIPTDFLSNDEIDFCPHPSPYRKRL